MTRLLWIAADPFAVSTGSLMSWPVCRGLAACGIEVSYLALGAKRPPESIDGVAVVPPILQDPLEPEGVGGKQNLFNYIFKRIGPDAIVLCLDDCQLSNLLYQIREVAGNSLPVWKWILPNGNGLRGIDNAVVTLPCQLRRFDQAGLIRPGVEPPAPMRRGDAIISLGRDMPRLIPDQTLEMWRVAASEEQTLLWVADDARYAKTGIEADKEKTGLSSAIRVVEISPSGLVSPIEQISEGASRFFVETPERLNTIGAVECVLAGLVPFPGKQVGEADSDHFLVPCSAALARSESWFSEAAEIAKTSYRLENAVNQWLDVIERGTRRPVSAGSRSKRIQGINFKGHIWGNGSMSLAARNLALALDALRVPVSLEATTGKRADSCTMKPSPSDMERLLEMQRKKIDPSEYAHIRYGGPQSSEHHLREGLVDITMLRRNIIYWSVDYSSLGGPGCPSPQLINETASQVWVLSQHNYRSMLECGVRRELLRIVPNGYDERAFHSGAKPLQLESRRFTFLTVANLKFFYRKGLDVLIDAYTAEFNHREDVHLIIQSPTAANLDLLNGHISEAARKYGRRPAITVWDQPMTAQQLASLYKACDCLVCPSRGESFGLPPLESLAVGTPVIVTGWGGMMDYCSSEVAYIVDYRLSPAHTWVLNGWGGGFWADPDRGHLGYLMRYAYEHSEENLRKGANALSLVKDWTWEKAAQKARIHLREFALQQ